MGIAIVGAGGHGRVALECLELAAGVRQDVAFFDDGWEGIAPIEGFSVLGPIALLAHDSRFMDVFVAIGSNRVRQRVFLELREFSWSSPQQGSRFLRSLIPIR